MIFVRLMFAKIATSIMEPKGYYIFWEVFGMGKIVNKIVDYGIRGFECFSVGYVGLTLVKMIKYFTKEIE